MFLTYTTLLPGTHSALTILKGPEPVGSSMFLNASVLAMRSGMMNGTFDEGLASASKASGKAFLSLRRKVLSLTAVHDSLASASFCPSASRLPQRSIEAMQSADLTATPSWNLRPSRNVNV